MSTFRDRLADSALASYNNQKEEEPEKKFTDEERDLFAMSFAAWYAHGEDAAIYRSMNKTAYEMLNLYKDRPYLRTDAPQEN